METREKVGNESKQVNVNDKFSIVVFANRKDYFFTKLCVASARFYYPEVEILLVKDRLNGNFDSSLLCSRFNVKEIKLPKRYFGWSAAKLHFLLQRSFPAKRYFCLDSDMIFIGRVLDNLLSTTADFVLNAEFYAPPFEKEFADLYVEPDEVQTFYSDYEYPGYFFNAGQTLVTPGLLDKEILQHCFDPEIYPYYKNQHVFKLVDQAVLNGILPVLAKRKGATIQTMDYMKWSVSFFSVGNYVTFDQISDGSLPFVLHYAGDTRTHRLEQMKGAAILKEFKKFYTDGLSPQEIRKDEQQNESLSVKWITRILYRKNWLLIKTANYLKRYDWY